MWRQLGNKPSRFPWFCWLGTYSSCFILVTQLVHLELLQKVCPKGLNFQLGFPYMSQLQYCSIEVLPTRSPILFVLFLTSHQYPLGTAHMVSSSFKVLYRHMSLEAARLCLSRLKTKDAPKMFETNRGSSSNLALSVESQTQTGAAISLNRQCHPNYW